MEPYFCQLLASLNATSEVESQELFCHATSGREWNDFAAHQAEVCRPSLRAWIEQTHKLTGNAIDGRDIGTFEPVTVRTGQCEIRSRAPATVF